MSDVVDVYSSNLSLSEPSSATTGPSLIRALHNLVLVCHRLQLLPLLTLALLSVLLGLFRKELVEHVVFLLADCLVFHPPTFFDFGVAS